MNAPKRKSALISLLKISSLKISLWKILLLMALIPSLNVHAQDDEEDLSDQVENLIAKIESMTQMGPAELWAPELRELIEFGRPATLPICSALKRSNNPFHIRLYGFALRAINDPRAVPTLIESIPGTLCEPMSDVGVRLANRELLDFLQRYDLDPNDLDDDFVLGRPNREIIRAIEGITGHDFEDAALVSSMLAGGELHQYLQKKAYHDFATKLTDWWYDNYQESGADMDFVNVDLQEFTLERPEAKLSFFENSAMAGFTWKGLIIQPPTREKRTYCFYDLDRGIRAGLGSSYEGTLDDLEAIEKWAIESGFDLMGLQAPVRGHEGLQYVVKPLGLKLWQTTASRFESFPVELGNSDFDIGIPCNDFLMYLDPDTACFDPNRQTTFFYQTREGTCGAILLVAQVNKVIDPDKPTGARGLQDNHGPRLGVKLNLKFVYQH